MNLLNLINYNLITNCYNNYLLIVHQLYLIDLSRVLIATHAIIFILN